MKVLILDVPEIYYLEIKLPLPIVNGDAHAKFEHKKKLLKMTYIIYIISTFSLPFRIISTNIHTIPYNTMLTNNFHPKQQHQ